MDWIYSDTYSSIGMGWWFSFLPKQSHFTLLDFFTALLVSICCVVLFDAGMLRK